MLQVSVSHQINELKLEVELDLHGKGSVIGVFGASGHGKSTLLRILAGLEKQANYQLGSHGLSDVYGVSIGCNHSIAEQNPCVLNRQKALLFPHLTVLQNLEFVIKHSYWRTEKQTVSEHKVSRDISIHDVIQWFNLKPIIHKSVDALSGGEQQRVAIARSLLSGKPIVLLDEPFSALDWQTRISFLTLLPEIARRFNICFVLVSHSLKELAIATDYMLCIRQGHAEEHGNTADLINELGQIAGQPVFSNLTLCFQRCLPEYRLSQWALSDAPQQHIYFKQVVAEAINKTPQIQNDDVIVQQKRITLDADQVSISRHFNADTSMLNQLKGKVLNICEQEHMALVSLSVGEQRLFAQISKLSLHRLNLQPNEVVYAQFKAL
ncbi:MAG: ATP-binding cassette domain-containing protein [Gammaproteobacteria bacterium]|nr:ATP-binding cassette domain-containing protein [Gammaproteobacteria bacterium]